MKKTLAALCIFLLAAGCTGNKKKKHDLPPVAVTVAKSRSQTVPVFIETVGHIDGLNVVDIQSQVTGVLVAAFFEEGTLVKKGDLMLQIDDRPYRAALEQAQAELDKSLAALKYAQDTTMRNTPLVKDEFVSQNYYENLVTQVLENEAMVKEQMAAVETAKINLGYCYIYAPMDAMAGNRNIDPGNLLLATDPQTVVTLEQVQPINCIFYISEKDLPHIQMLRKQRDLPVVVSYKDDFKETRQGILSFIDNSVDPSTGLIKMKGRFANEDMLLWPGEYIHTRLILDTIENAVLVPAEAVVTETKGKFIFVVDKNLRAQKKNIKLGQRINDEIVVLEGLKAEESVVTEGQFNLVNGTRVKIQTQEDIQRIISQ